MKAWIRSSITRGIFTVILFANMLMIAARNASAHARSYVFNQEYKTLPKGMFEVEGQTDFKIPDRHATNANNIEYQGEVEYGVTDHLNIAHYERWETQNQAGPDDATVYTGFKFEAKYRIGEKGKYWVDPLLYLEWATNPREDDHPNELEGKIILSKDLGKFNITYNQILESELGSKGRTTPGFTTGVNYEVLAGLHVGTEFKGEYWHPGTQRNELAMGPTIAYEWKYFWVATGALFGLNHAADDMEFRITFGIPIG